MRAVMLAVLLMCSCGPTSYTKATSSRDMGSARHMITVRGNSRTTSDVILEYTDRRATELCPNGYDIVQTSGGITNAAVISQATGAVTQGRRADQSTVVQCHVGLEQRQLTGNE